MTLRNIKLTIQYDGSDYHGWQQQPGMRTVEGAVTEAIAKLIGCEINLTGSSRTDAGVSALGQVANFKIDKDPALVWIPFFLFESWCSSCAS